MLELKRGNKCSKNFVLADRILTLDSFYEILETNLSIFARHRMYPTAFFYSWQIRQVKIWIDNGWFYTASKI